MGAPSHFSKLTISTLLSYNSIDLLSAVFGQKPQIYTVYHILHHCEPGLTWNGHWPWLKHSSCFNHNGLKLTPRTHNLRWNLKINAALLSTALPWTKLDWIFPGYRLMVMFQDLIPSDVSCYETHMMLDSISRLCYCKEIKSDGGSKKKEKLWGKVTTFWQGTWCKDSITATVCQNMTILW